jgi:hypothetical protein
MPWTPARAARTWVSWSALATTVTGWPWPAAKCRASASSPVTEGCLVVKLSAVDRPLALSWSRPSAIAPSASAVPTQTARGRWAIRPPRRAQKPVAVGSAEPNLGRAGQNSQRPQITRNAGSSVIMASRPTTMPSAATGPRPAVELSSASVRIDMPTATVAALAMIAGPARCRAIAIASCRSSCLRNSSRYRAMSSSA